MENLEGEARYMLGIFEKIFLVNVLIAFFLFLLLLTFSFYAGWQIGRSMGEESVRVIHEFESKQEPAVETFQPQI